MLKKQALLSLFLLLAFPVIIFSQGKSAFTGDPEKFRSELVTFMGPNLKPEQLSILNTFLAKWDSTSFSAENKTRIIDVSSQMSSRYMRPVPHFNDFLATLIVFAENNKDETFFKNWITGLSELAFMPRFSNDNLHRYFKNTGSMIKENILLTKQLGNKDYDFEFSTENEKLKLIL